MPVFTQRGEQCIQVESQAAYWTELCRGQPQGRRGSDDECEKHEEIFDEFNDTNHQYPNKTSKKTKTNLTTKIPKPSLRYGDLRGVLCTALGFACLFTLSLIRLNHVRGEMFGCILLRKKVHPPRVPQEI
jgi:hypothetical protein